MALHVTRVAFGVVNVEVEVVVGARDSLFELKFKKNHFRPNRRPSAFVSSSTRPRVVLLLF